MLAAAGTCLPGLSSYGFTQDVVLAFSCHAALLFLPFCIAFGNSAVSPSSIRGSVPVPAAVFAERLSAGPVQGGFIKGCRW